MDGEKNGGNVVMTGFSLNICFSCVIPSLSSSDQTTEIGLPLYMTCIEAGFPSPADDYIEGKLDLNEHLIKHPAAAFFARVVGGFMIKAGIFP